MLGVHHVAVSVRDLGDAMQFYCDQLGFTVVPDRPDFGFPGAWLAVGGQQLHLLEDPNCKPEAAQHFAIECDDLDATVAEVAGRGVEVSKTVLIPGAGRQAFCRDPSGNGVELRQSA